MANCFVNIWACCSRKKREVVPYESNTYSIYVQNVATQTPMPPVSEFIVSRSLPMLKLNEKVVNRGNIMVRNGDSFQSQSSDEFSNSRKRKFTSSPKRGGGECSFVKRNHTFKDNIQNNFHNPFVFKGNSMPKLNPITPRRSTKSNYSLPPLKKEAIKLINEIEENQMDLSGSPSNY